MDERQRRERQLEALELIAEQLERLRVLKEHELGAKAKEVEGNLTRRRALEELEESVKRRMQDRRS